MTFIFRVGRGLGTVNRNYTPGAPTEPNPGDISPDAPTVLQIWYDGSVNTYIQPTNRVDGEGITQWNDRSAFAHNLNPVGGNPSDRPTYRTNQLNSLSTLQFDGTDTSDSNPFTISQGLTGATLFIVSKFTNGGNSTEEFVTSLDAGDLGFGKNSSDEYLLRMTDLAGGAARAEGTAGTVDTNYHIQSIIYNGSGITNADKLRFRLDKSNVALGFSGNVASSTSSTNNAFIAAADENEANTFTGFIGEIILYSRTLTDGEITSVETFLGDKWNL
jgi:hypothetical protein